MRGRREACASGRRTIQPLILAAAALWLLLTVCVVAGIQPAAASARDASSLSIAADTSTPTTTVPAATATPVPPTATATDSPAPVDTPTNTPAATDTPTDTPVGNSGGGNPNGDTGGGNGPTGGNPASSAAPNVTRVVFSQPTVAAGNDSAVPGLAGATFGSNGLLLATTMSCVVGLLGLTVAGIALAVLTRRGYGPFLRALLRGKRAGRRRGTRGKDGGFEEDDGAAAFAAEARAWRGGPGAASGTAGRGGYEQQGYGRRGMGSGVRQPPVTRSRSDWR